MQNINQIRITQIFAEYFSAYYQSAFNNYEQHDQSIFVKLIRSHRNYVTRSADGYNFISQLRTFDRE